jgi:hypothetical protein
MADRLYLSLWYPNFRLETLPSALTGVIRQFTLVGAKRVSAASAYPIDFTESPTYQRIYVNRGADPSPSSANTPPELTPPTEESDGLIEAAVAEATEQLHDDMAYEFEMRWQLWSLDPLSSSPARPDYSIDLAPQANVDSDNDLDLDDPDFNDHDSDDPTSADPETPWRLRTHTVRILGFGPHFDVAGYEQNGHLLVDFGLDTPWVLDTPAAGMPPEIHLQRPLDEEAQLHIQQNIEKLLAFTLLVEKNCGISSRLLWTESGEPLAEKLIARLQRVN